MTLLCAEAAHLSPPEHVCPEGERETSAWRWTVSPPADRLCLGRLAKSEVEEGGPHARLATPREEGGCSGAEGASREEHAAALPKLRNGLNMSEKKDQEKDTIGESGEERGRRSEVGEQYGLYQ